MHQKRLLFFLILFLGLLSVYTWARPTPPAAAPHPLSFDLRADGSCRIAWQKQTVALGSIRFFNAHSWFHRQPVLASPTEPLRSRLVRGRLEQTYPELDFTLTVKQHQEDLHFEATIHNRSPETLSLWGVDGWNFLFPESPKGYANDYRWNMEYLRANGLSTMHPSYWYRLACSYQTTPSWGIGLTPDGLGVHRSLWYWHATPQPGAKERRLTFLVEKPVLPKQMITVRWIWRISAQTDWQHLLTPYREQHLRTFGPLRYHPDHRPVIQGLRCDPTHTAADNPYGYVPNSPWRFDRREGALSYGRTMSQAAVEAGCQGLIAWGWAYFKDDLWYPLDSNDLPPEVQRNVDLIRAAFREQSLRAGALIRYGYMSHMRRDGLREPAVQARHSEVAVDLLVPRFRRLEGLGYLDDAGLGDGDGSTRSPMDDVLNLAALRERLGPTHQWYLEHASDWSLPHAGFFTYVTKHEDRFTPYPLGDWQLAVMRWLYPGAAVIGAMHGPVQQDELIRVCIEQLRISPVIQDWLLVSHVPLLQQYLKPGKSGP